MLRDATGLIVCPNCKEAKPANNKFYGRRKTAKNGLASHCLKCCRAKARAKAVILKADPDYPSRKKSASDKYRFSEKGRATIRRLAPAYNAKRRQANMSKQWIWSSKLWAKCKSAFGNRCAYCADDHRKLQQDHFIAINTDGFPGTVPWNMVPACSSCNAKKGDRPAEQYFATEQLRSEALEYLRTARLMYAQLDIFATPVTPP